MQLETALAEIEKELQSVIEEDKKSWIRVYELMAAVESEKLYKKDYTSYTQWVNKIAADMHVHVSLLWRRKKAGAFYSEYQERMRKKGKQVYFADIEGVSPDNLVIAEKIAGSNTKVADQLIEKIQHGELKRKDLSNALAAVRRSRAEKGISAPKNGYERKKQMQEPPKESQPDQKKITALDIVAALEINRDWIGEAVEKQGRVPKYKVFTEFGIDSPGTRNARRIDALVVETVTTDYARRVQLHGIEIKVSRSDLLHDEKMAEYTQYVDDFWIAIPQYLVDDAVALALPDWGIMSIDKDQLEVVRSASKNTEYGIFRENTLSEVVYKLM